MTKVKYIGGELAEEADGKADWIAYEEAFFCDNSQFFVLVLEIDDKGAGEVA